MARQISEESVIVPLTLLGGSAGSGIGVLDIGGTNGATAWTDMSGYNRARAFVMIGQAWNAADDLDECRIEVASDASGNNPEEVTSDGAGLDYDTGNPIDAAGDFVVIEIRGENLPAGKTFIRLYVAEGGNTGVDNVLGFIELYDARDKQAHKQGAPAVGSKVYITA